MKHLSFSRRILGLVVAIFVLQAFYILVNDYLNAVDRAESFNLERLEGIATDIASRIDGDQHQRLTSRYSNENDISTFSQDADYQAIHEILANTVASFKLKTPIYTFVKSKDKDYFLEFIVTSSKEPYYRHGYSSFPRDDFAKLDQGGVLPAYKDDYGHWLSAFQPILNQQNEIVAYVQVDEKMDLFLAEVRSEVFRSAFLTCVAFGVFILIFLPYLRNLLALEEKRKLKLGNTLKEMQNLSEELALSKRQLEENARQLEQSNKDLVDFAHIASHDLRAPIRNIASFAQLIERNKNCHLDEDGKEWLNFIITGAKGAQNLISGLLKYSTADKDMGEPESFSITDAVRIAEHNLKKVIEEKKAKVTYSEMPVVNANRMLIAQIFQNLISNGLKYNESTNPEVEVGFGETEDKQIYFFVKDNGIGIPAEYRESIFKMFTRLHTAEKYEGSGIGLAFCSRVVGAYDGRMWLESIEGQQTTFFFTLPKAVPQLLAVAHPSMD